MNILIKLKSLYEKYKIIIVVSATIILICVFSIVLLFSIKQSNKVNNSFEKEVAILNVDEPLEEVKKADDKTIYVDIKGNVDKPGVYKMDSMSRVKDVIEAAGGLLGNANTRYINMSKILSDEMVIIIYSNEEIDNMKNANVKSFIEYIEKPCECDISNDACIKDNSSSGNLININTATMEELTVLSGIGLSKAKAIIEYRDEHGNFENIEDIKNVSGISDATFDSFKENITTK